MGFSRNKKKLKTAPQSSLNVPDSPPIVARRTINHQTTIRSGRTIAAKREQLETANERAAARKKAKKQKTSRLILVSIVFIFIIGLIVGLIIFLLGQPKKGITDQEIITKQTLEPSSKVKIIDDEASATGGKITARMKEYIALVEADFADMGYVVEKAILPANSIREVDFYLQGVPGYIKMVIDRGPAVSVEDADRTIRYLTKEGITAYQYIDVRIKGRAFYLPQ